LPASAQVPVAPGEGPLTTDQSAPDPVRRRPSESRTAGRAG